MLMYFNFPANFSNEFGNNENGCRFIKMNVFSR